MSLVRVHPFSRSMWPTIWDDEDFFGSMTQASNNLDVYETEDEVVVKANVAGVPNENVDITFEKGILRITAEKSEEESDKKKQHYTKSSWNYSYRVALPGMSEGMIDLNQEPDASISDGVITVSFKKSEASKPKKLTVKSK